MLPVIGVTASVSDDRLSFQQKRMYCEAISACGGLPLILPPQEDVSRASQVLSLLNGLLLAGGCAYAVLRRRRSGGTPAGGQASQPAISSETVTKE